jgi:type VI secretion system protein ImpG
VSAFFDQRPTDSQRGQPCEVRFGAAPGSATVTNNPLERLRLLLHYPELELSLHIAVPLAQAAWTRMAIAFDLDSKWPDSRCLGAEPFQQHAVPVINLSRAPAASIRCDGLQSSYPIMPNVPQSQVSLHSVLGVFEMKGEGLTPLPSASLPGSEEGYEIERIVHPGGLKHRLLMRLREAFAEPRRIAVDAEWYQPSFSKRAVGPIEAWLPNHGAEGLQWRLIGSLQSNHDTPINEMSSALFELLAMRMKPVLRREEVLSLLRLLGATDDSPFGPVMAKVRDLTVEVCQDAGALGGGARYRYRLRIDPVAPADEALMWTLIARIRELLDAWSGGAAVGIEVDVDTNQTSMAQLPDWREAL